MQKEVQAAMKKEVQTIKKEVQMDEKTRQGYDKAFAQVIGG